MKFALLTLIVYMGLAFTFSLIIPFMKSLGWEVVRQTQVMAFGALLTIFGQFIVGYLADRYRTDKKVFYLAKITLTLITWLLYSRSSSPFLLMALLVGLLSAFYGIVQSILDTWIIESDEYCLVNYGWARVFGSIGWAIGAPLTSYFFARAGYTSLGTVFLFFSVLALAIAFFIDDAKKVQTKEKLKLIEIRVLLQQRNFVLLTLVFLFFNIIAWTDGITTIYKIQELGLSLRQSEQEINGIISLKYSFQAVCELPLFFLGAWLVKKFGSIRLVMFATLFLSLRFVLSGLAQSPMQLVYIASLQAITFPLILICSKVLIAQVSPEHLIASGQQIAIAVHSGVSALVSPLLCGLLGHNYSFNFVLFAAAAFCGLPLVLLFVYTALNKEQRRLKDVTSAKTY